jgi:hypothetical protein
MNRLSVLSATITGLLALSFQLYAQDQPDFSSEQSDLLSHHSFNENSDYGIVAGPTIGLTGRAAVGTLSHIQSRWGASGFFVYPTGQKTQLRIIAGMPLSGSDDILRDNKNTVPDIYAGLEYEWGMKYFGIGCGLGFMYLQPFTRTTSDYFMSPVVLHFKEAFSTNWILNIRGGKPNSGFFGRISWPIPILNDGRIPDQFFVDYSALGVFGNDVIRGGLGIQGMYKHRQATEDQSSNFEDMYVMGPCGKLAFRLGKQSVIAISTDISSLFFPRPEGLTDWGAPYIQLNYTFSLKPLRGAEIFDGTF